MSLECQSDTKSTDLKHLPHLMAGGFHAMAETVRRAYIEGRLDTLLTVAKAGILSCIVHVCTLRKIHMTTGVCMCGRFTIATHAEALEERFHAHLSTELA